MQETQETRVWFLGQEDPLEKEIATHSGILAWRIPWIEKPGAAWRLQFKESLELKKKKNPPVLSVLFTELG